MTELYLAGESLRTTRDGLEGWEHDEASAAEMDKTVVKGETYLGRTQPDASPPPLLGSVQQPSTPLKKPQVAGTPTPESFHVATDEPFESDGEGLEHEREEALFEMWRKDQLIQLQGKISKLETQKRILLSREFPGVDDWIRNKQFIAAAEKGRKLYSNDTFSYREMGNQMLARELKRSLEGSLGAAEQHPVHQMKKREKAAK